jgi:hypothetical protein
MNKKETLFYKDTEYKKISESLKRLEECFNCDFMIVGGIANRALFFNWAENLAGETLNDIDITLLPKENSPKEEWFDSSIKKDFFLTHISFQYDGYYMALIDKKNYLAIDVFTRPREVETQKIDIENKKYKVLTNEEIYLSVLRNIYETLINDNILDPKHIKFKKYLEKFINMDKALKMWHKEKNIIRFRKDKYNFETLKEYQIALKKLQTDKKELIYKKNIPPGKKQYNPNMIEANGVSIEKEDVFQEAYRLKRKAQEDISKK